MTVADYIFAAIGLVIALAWCGGSLLVSQTGAFVPAPGAAEKKAFGFGCASLIAGLAVLAWFGGVLWNGEWGWLA